MNLEILYPLCFHLKLEKIKNIFSLSKNINSVMKKIDYISEIINILKKKRLQ